MIAAAPQEGPKPAATVDVPAGTIMAVELVDPVHSGKNKEGDAFRARVNEGVWVRGRVALPPGTTVRGVVTEAVPSGRVKGQARLSLALKSLDLDGKSYELKSDVLSYKGDPHGGRHVGAWLMGALQGALYGVLFGGKEGAVIGAGAGAAAGGAGAILKGKQDLDFPQGSKFMFETLAPVTVPEPPPAPPAPVAPPAPAAPPAPELKPSTTAPVKPEAKPAG